jgi:hypothetical protein
MIHHHHKPSDLPYCAFLTTVGSAVTKIHKAWTLSEVKDGGGLQKNLHYIQPVSDAKL